MKTTLLTGLGGLLAILLSCNNQPVPQPEISKSPTISPSALRCEDLSGMSFLIALVSGGKQEGTEILSFQDGSVQSSECLKYGFAASPYQCQVAGDGTLVMSSMMSSEKEGRMDWKGIVRDQKVEGTVRWTKPGQADIDYTFRGDRQ